MMNSPSRAEALYDALGRGATSDVQAINRALADAERSGMERAASIVRGYPPSEFFRLLNASTTESAVAGFRVFEGDTGNWAYLMSVILEPYAGAILAEAGNRRGV